MINKKLSGMGVALITPFHNNDAVDFDALGRLIEFQIEGKTDYFVVGGTTAETPTLSDEELDSVKEFCVNKIAGRRPIVLGIGGNNTKTVINKISKTNLSGIDAILSVTPCYNKPTQEGLFQHFSVIAEISPLPIILYNVPGRTGVNMTAETTIRLANKFSNICGIKEASCDFNQVNELLKNKPADFMVISGDDESTLPLISLGACGVISVIGNAFPKEFCQMIHFALKGDYENARCINTRFANLFRLAFVEGNPAGVKNMLFHTGFIKDKLRLPLVPVSSKTNEKIKLAIGEFSPSL